MKNELKIIVPKGWGVTEEVILDGSRVFTFKPDTTCHKRKGIFRKVTASELRLDDEILKYQPKTEAEQNFKNLVETAIKNGLKDFWRPTFDPSFDDNRRICYESGEIIAVGKTYNWWKKSAKKFAPECGSRLGTKFEYVAFLAVLIKELVASGKSLEWAWNAVCNDSKELGHYRNSSNAKEKFELTGSREVCGWYDLANSYKILSEDEEAGGLWIAGGGYSDCGHDNPLAELDHDDKPTYYDFSSCGWLVCDSCPDC